MRLNKKAYKQLIKEDIAYVRKHMPHSLERFHIIAVLKDAVDKNYPKK